MSTTKPQPMRRESAPKAREGKEWHQSGAEEAPKLRTEEAKHREVAQEDNLAPDQEGNVPKVIISATTERSVATEQSRGVILSYLFKEEPPDAPLLHETREHTVSRAKLSQVGENGVDNSSMPTKEHSEATEKLIKVLGKNQSDQVDDVGDLLGAYQSNHEELRDKPTCSRILNSSNYFKPVPELEVTHITSWQTSLRAYSANGSEIELHSQSHSQSRPQTTCRMLVDLLRTPQA